MEKMDISSKVQTTARVSPKSKLTLLFGSAADGKPRDPHEKAKVRKEIGRVAVGKIAGK